MRRNPRYWYSGPLDRIGKQSVARMVRYSHPEKIWAVYRQQGFDVYGCGEVPAVPTPLVEKQVSQWRRRWRHWLYAEALVGAAVGPLGMAITVSGLSVICVNWGIQMGWTYGINMESLSEQDALRLLVARGLRDAMGLDNDRQGLRKIVDVGINVVLLSFGQDLLWADKVMGRVRHHWRVKSGRLSATQHEISTFRQSSATIHQNGGAEPLEFAHNGRNSDGETRRCAT